MNEVLQNEWKQNRQLAAGSYYTLTIIGGTSKETIQKMGQKAGFYVWFDDALKPKQPKYRRMISDSDCVIVLIGACSHKAMWMAKHLAKELEIPIRFSQGRGISGAFMEAAKVCYNQK
ncbi:DUF2325 domain-containing protein [Salibacterium aidingense]|uniref:DUF2325 domain-containing protein n=1 Tax=Salibacterium aidingense TaxID=384933 RepID=UPI0003F59DE4|nr:DUF2325 domain-containing protein [Salibacterium aidingense]